MTSNHIMFEIAKQRADERAGAAASDRPRRDRGVRTAEPVLSRVAAALRRRADRPAAPAATQPQSS